VENVGVEDDAWGVFRLDSLRLVVVGDGAVLLVCSVWRGAVAKVGNVKLLVPCPWWLGGGGKGQRGGREKRRRGLGLGFLEARRLLVKKGGGAWYGGHRSGMVEIER
jgi:hypothetical protein